ncbi:hypothetical protein INR49_030486 [Caranx melampygus]|nr:hypothetical protein INR49_030486 [Caranx melampygus]
MKVESNSRVEEPISNIPDPTSLSARAVSLSSFSASRFVSSVGSLSSLSFPFFRPPRPPSRRRPAATVSPGSSACFSSRCFSSSASSSSPALRIELADSVLKRYFPFGHDATGGKTATLLFP